MICYASRTGTKRNLDALRGHGWHLLISRAGAWRTEGFDHIAGENGAWADYQAGRIFDEDAYERFLDWLIANVLPLGSFGAPILDWLVLPDVVAGGLHSLELSMRYMNRCLAVSPLVLLAVQNGMRPADVEDIVGPGVGIFLGGTTEWKLQTMWEWGEFCATFDLYYHVARVNSMRRTIDALMAGADSVDGSSGSRYAVTIPKLTSASRQRLLFTARTLR